MNITLNQIQASVLGFCVGDALGVPFEFKPRAKFKESPVVDMIGYGTYNQPKGTWSDDSALVFAHMTALCKGYKLKSLADEMVRYLFYGAFTPYGQVFDVGETTRKSIQRYRGSQDATTCGEQSVTSNGNGSLMRILPLAFYLAKEPEIQTRKTIVEEVSSLTHAHIYSKIACVYFVEYIRRLLLKDCPQHAYIKTNQIISNLYTLEELHPFQKILGGGLPQLPSEQLNSTGYSVYALEVALWCFLRSVDYSSAVLTAINLGEDTDTNAAICGALSGLYYGLDSINPTWIESLARIDDINNLITKFWKAIQGQLST